MDPNLAATSLLDPSALVVVIAGTAIATAVRAGWGDLMLAVKHAASLAKTGFETDANRTAMARWARSVRERGVLGADEPYPPDSTLARALDALVRSGSLRALENVHQMARAERLSASTRAAHVFEQAGDLAPVFGLVGTLYAMTQITPEMGADPSAATFAAIATAVLSSLYGVLSAHLVFLPIGAAILRRSSREEDARDTLVEWLSEEIAEFVPGGSGARRLTSLKPVA